MGGLSTIVFARLACMSILMGAHPQHGTFSTAWMALDEQTASYVAVKVGTADAGRREMDTLSRLTQDSARTKTMIPAVLDRFEINGPNDHSTPGWHLVSKEIDTQHAQGVQTHPPRHRLLP